jgi:hypothetical protein
LNNLKVLQDLGHFVSILADNPMGRAATDPFPRPKVCVGNDDAANTAAEAPLLFLIAATSLLFLAEALNIVAAKGWGAQQGRRIGAASLLHRG